MINFKPRWQLPERQWWQALVPEVQVRAMPVCRHGPAEEGHLQGPAQERRQAAEAQEEAQQRGRGFR